MANPTCAHVEKWQKGNKPVVKYDNLEENKTLQAQINGSATKVNIQFEYTARTHLSIFI